MKVLKEFKEPTNVVITGQWVGGEVEPSLSITDDECILTVRNFKGKKFNLAALGSITILTEEQFNWFIDSDHYKMYCDDDFGNIEDMYIPIKGYVGNIEAVGVTYDGDETVEWEIEDYFYHQVEDANLILDIKGEYNFDSMNVNEAKKFLKSNEISKTMINKL